MHLGVTLGPLFPGNVRVLASWEPCQLSLSRRSVRSRIGPVPFPGGGRRRDWLSGACRAWKLHVTWRCRMKVLECVGVCWCWGLPGDGSWTPVSCTNAGLGTLKV